MWKRWNMNYVGFLNRYWFSYDVWSYCLDILGIFNFYILRKIWIGTCYPYLISSIFDLDLIRMLLLINFYLDILIAESVKISSYLCRFVTKIRKYLQVIYCQFCITHQVTRCNLYDSINWNWVTFGLYSWTMLYVKYVTFIWNRLLYTY